MKFQLLTVILFVVGLTIAGCSGDDSSGRISGTVSLDGAPLASGSISFAPTSSQGQNVGGKITDGKYELPIEPGEYLVEIHSPVVVGKVPLYEGDDSSTRDVTKESIPTRYNAKSELTVSATTGTNQKDFELKKAK